MCPQGQGHIFTLYLGLRTTVKYSLSANSWRLLSPYLPLSGLQQGKPRAIVCKERQPLDIQLAIPRGFGGALLYRQGCPGTWSSLTSVS